MVVAIANIECQNSIHLFQALSFHLLTRRKHVKFLSGLYQVTQVTMNLVHLASEVIFENAHYLNDVSCREVLYRQMTYYIRTEHTGIFMS